MSSVNIATIHHDSLFVFLLLSLAHQGLYSQNEHEDNYKDNYKDKDKVRMIQLRIFRNLR